MKRPAFQFYPADWRKDAALQLCSIASRGLWWEMICIMHDAKPYGHLIAAGKPVDVRGLSRLVGESSRDVDRWLSELREGNVFSANEEGVIFSRRMVKDEKARQAWRERQDRHRHGDNGRDKWRDNTGSDTVGVTPMSPRSSSSSSSSPSVTTKALDASRLVGKDPDATQPKLAKPPKVNGKYHDPSPSSTALASDAKAVLSFLNERAGKRFPESETNVGIIVARMREGFTAAQVRQVVAFKVRAWKTDEKMREYLRPATLFARSNFSNYVGELVPETGEETTP